LQKDLGKLKEGNDELKAAIDTLERENKVLKAASSRTAVAKESIPFKQASVISQ
jgi:cell division protein FtsB